LGCSRRAAGAILSASLAHFPAERAHTYAFLKDARQTCHVYLMTDVDASQIKAARSDSGNKISFVTFVVKAAADVIAAFPEACAVLKDGFRPKLATTPEISAKVLFDKTIRGRRCVVSGTVENTQHRSLSEIQSAIDEYKQAEVAQSGPFSALWKLQRLPLPLVRLVYQAVLRDPARRAKFQGTFSVTSAGQESVRAIFPMIAGTVGLGVGRIADTPVVRDGQVTVAPIVTLSLTFDHRVIDGALAAELLTGIKNRLESWRTQS
jgi:pyruvate/2-oxoglutarate dehydrogenase complex dihydrolipoamide acyltransferase (E2) component